LAVYIPPNLPKDVMDSIVSRIIDRADQLITEFPDHQLILAGDFNRTCTRNIEQELNLIQTVTESTRGAAILDKIFIDASLVDSYRIPVVGPNLGKSDHGTVLLYPHRQLSRAVKVKKLYDLRASNLEKVRDALAAIPWQNFYRSEANIDGKCEFLHETITNALKHIPCEEILIKENNKPWITPVIISLINKRFAAFRARNFPLYHHFKKKVKKEINKAKQNWVERTNVQGGKMWKIINTFRNKKQNNQLSDIIISFSTPSDAANGINNSFAQHFTQNPVEMVDPTFNNEKWNVCISTQIVYDHLRKLKSNKAAGSDNLSPRVLVALADIIAGPLTHLFCLSIDSEYMPQKWKMADIHPIPKKTHPRIDDLRPISVLPIFSKILEKIVLSSIKDLLIDRYGSNQFGFRPHSSTLHAHICLHNFVTETLEDVSTRSVMLIPTDLRRAFDSLCHHTLLTGLDQSKLPHSFLKWCKSFLENRFQRVILDSSASSETIKVTSGVPQGSVLSPYLFAAHMGSLKPNIPDAHMLKYADDVITAIPVHKSHDVDALIREHLHGINSWCSTNGLMLNCDKTKILMITKKGQAILPLEKQHLNYICNELKFLGVMYNSKLTWTTHVEYTCKKARRNLYILKQLKKFASKQCLITAYTSLVQSILEYCGPVFLGIDSCNNNHLNKIQRRSHFIVCGPKCTCSSFEKLDDRRSEQSLKILDSMRNPQSLLHYLLPRTLDKSRSLAMPQCSTNRRLKSFIPQVILLSNQH